MLTSAALERDRALTNAGAVTVFAVLLIIPTVVGFVPLALFIDRPLWLVAVAVFAVLIAAIYAVQLSSIQGRPLTFLEAVASALGGLYFSSSISLFLLVSFALASRVVVPLLSLVNVHWDADVVGRDVVGAMGLIYVSATTVGIAENLRRRLFPKTGVGNAPLFPALTWRRFLRGAAIGLVPAAVLVALWLFGWIPGSWACVLSQFYLLGVSFPLVSQWAKPPLRAPAVVEAVRILLRAIGYTTPDRVQTRDARLDRLIAVFDVVAYGDGNALAFQFKTGGKDSTPVAWTEAASLRTATRAIFIVAEQFGVPIHNVNPVMVLAGRQPDDSLKTFTKQESIRIVEIQNPILIEDIIANKYSSEALRQLAQSILGLRVPTVGDKAAAAEPVQELK